MIFFYIVGWLVFSHTVLLRLFTCCKKRKKLHFEKVMNKNQIWPILSAHRGGSLERTENTLTAFKHAMTQGTTLLECDVHLTKDGVVVINHDNDLQRLCGVQKDFKEFTYNELPPINKKFTTHFSEQVYEMRPEEDGKFTTLRELFEIAPNSLISIDLKGDCTDLRFKVNDLIKEFQRESLTIWGSVKPKMHKLIGDLNPEVPQFYSATQTLAVYVLYYLGLLWLYPLPSDAFMVPLMTRQKVKMFGRHFEQRGFIAKFLFVIISAMLRNCKNLFAHLRRRGVLVVVWVLNEEEEFEEAMDIFGEEIDGMMTDCPTKLKQFVKLHSHL